jgi:hypothetical protein
VGFFKFPGDTNLLAYASYEYLSVLVGALSAIPISQFLYDILSRVLFQTEGKAVVTQDGFIIWLAIAVILSTIAACCLPAPRRA